MSGNIIEAFVETKPLLEPGFIPAVLWNRAYRDALEKTCKGNKIIVALEKSQDSISTYTTEIFSHTGAYGKLNIKYVERLVKFLLWMKGGFRLTIAGCDVT